MGVGVVVTSRSLHGVMVSTLARNESDVGFESRSRNMSHFHHTHDSIFTILMGNRSEHKQIDRYRGVVDQRRWLVREVLLYCCLVCLIEWID